ncbi:pilus assembly protein [Deinococcus roseus]|uniref:Invasion protein n=1 Tax=Deinococcus roseus TaxID=392414 RepID=A0ABQ2D3Y0_9DEIO|nr:pilus assembly protein [Deinococcus roseus]GGJ42104.1 hypothetical protein GCM10008938_30180 [Deinococcus roseus]
MNGLYMIHKYFGELLQIIPVVLLVWYAIRNKTPLQRIAPIMLDINVLLGILVLFVQKIPVSVWHPVMMLIAMFLGHFVARNTNRSVVIGAWVVNLLLIVGAILLAKKAVGPILSF